MHKKVFIVELSTDNPNNIDAAEVHLALIKYFVAFVRIDVKEAAQQSVQRTARIHGAMVASDKKVTSA